jgi:hypothetical protein
MPRPWRYSTAGEPGRRLSAVPVSVSSDVGEYAQRLFMVAPFELFDELWEAAGFQPAAVAQVGAFGEMDPGGSVPVVVAAR